MGEVEPTSGKKERVSPAVIYGHEIPRLFRRPLQRLIGFEEGVHAILYVDKQGLRFRFAEPKPPESERPV